MPTPGLSLVGFMDQQEAINHLRSASIPADPSDAALTVEWQAAQTRLGTAPVIHAGNPHMRAIPAAHQGHITQITQMFGQVLQTMPGIEFRMVEIAPLLAFQFAVDVSRSDQLCAGIRHPPRIAEMLPICLPTVPAQENIQVSQQGQSMIFKSAGLNFRMLSQGPIGLNQFGIVVGVSLPLVHVVRFNGRCYLHNGFHRAYAIARAGARYMPCVFRDVPDYQTVGIRAGATFGLPLLESTNPPTVDHFVSGRAYDIAMRKMIRVLHVSWADHVMPDE